MLCFHVFFLYFFYSLTHSLSLSLSLSLTLSLSHLVVCFCYIHLSFFHLSLHLSFISFIHFFSDVFFLFCPVTPLFLSHSIISHSLILFSSYPSTSFIWLLVSVLIP